MSLRLEQVTVPMLRACLLKVQSRSPHMAHRLQDLASRIFEHAYEMTGTPA